MMRHEEEEEHQILAQMPEPLNEQINNEDSLSVLMVKSGLSMSQVFQDALKYEVEYSSQMGEYKRYRVWYKWIETTLDVYTLPIDEYLTDFTQQGQFVKGVHYQLFPTHPSDKLSCFVKALTHKICRLLLIFLRGNHPNKQNNFQEMRNSKKFDLILDRNFTNALIPAVTIAIPKLYQQYKYEQTKNALVQVLVTLDRLGVAQILSYITVQSKPVHQSDASKVNITIYICVIELSVSLTSEVAEAYLSPFATVLDISTSKIIRFLPPKFSRTDEGQLLKFSIDPILQILSDFYLNKSYEAILKLYLEQQEIVVRNRTLLTNILTTIYNKVEHSKYLQWCEYMIKSSQLRQKQDKDLREGAVTIEQGQPENMRNNKKEFRMDSPVRSQKTSSLNSDRSNLEQRLQDFEQKGGNNFKDGRKPTEHAKDEDMYLLGQQYQYLLSKKKKNLQCGNDILSQQGSSLEPVWVDFNMFHGPKFSPQYLKMYETIKLSCFEADIKISHRNSSLAYQLGMYLSLVAIQEIPRMIKFYLIYQREMQSNSELSHQECRHFIRQHYGKCVSLALTDLPECNGVADQAQYDRLDRLKLRYRLLISALFMSRRFLQVTPHDVQSLEQACTQLEQQFQAITLHKNAWGSRVQKYMLVNLYSVIVPNLLLSSSLSLDNLLTQPHVQRKLRAIKRAYTKIKSFHQFLSEHLPSQQSIETKVVVSICKCITKVLSSRIKLLIAYYGNQECYKEALEQDIPIDVIMAQESAVHIKLLLTSIRDPNTLHEALSISDYFTLLLSQMINSTIQMLTSAQLVANSKHFAHMLSNVIVGRDTLCWFCRFIGLISAYVPSSCRNANLVKLYAAYLQIPTFQTQLYSLIVASEIDGFPAQQLFEPVLDSCLLYAENIQTSHCAVDYLSSMYVVSYLMRYAFELSTYYEYRQEIEGLIIRLLTFHIAEYSAQLNHFTIVLIFSIDKLQRGPQVLDMILAYSDQVMLKLLHEIEHQKSANPNFLQEIEAFREHFDLKGKKLTFTSNGTFDELCSLMWPSSSMETERQELIMNQSLYIKKIIQQMSGLNLYLYMLAKKKEEKLTRFFKRQYQCLIASGLKECFAEAKNINFYFRFQEDKEIECDGEGNKLIHSQLRLFDSMISNNNEEWVSIWQQAYLTSLQKNKQDLYFLNCYVSYLKPAYSDYLMLEVENEKLLIFIGLEYLRESTPTLDSFVPNWQLLSKICRVFNKHEAEVSKSLQKYRICSFKANLLFTTARMLEFDKQLSRARLTYHRFSRYQRKFSLMNYRLISSANVLHIIHRMYKKLESEVSFKDRNRKFIYVAVCQVCSYSCKREVQPVRARVLLMNKIRRAREMMKLENQEV